MKLNKTTQTSLIALGIIALSTSAQAALVIYDFNNGTGLDNVGVGGTMTVDGLTLTTEDVVGHDGSLDSAGGSHETNIVTNANALGVNSATTPLNAGNDARDFDPGEAWIFSFDQDVELTLLNVSSLDTVTELTISSSAFSDLVFVDGTANDDFDLLNTFVAAGTEITIMNTSVDSTVDDSHDFRITELHVNTVPEPSSTALLGLGGLALIMRRRM
ncbi:PEP-CTERM sorting domain-containing protein [Verrucomicrobiaceae bacterium R5-34]|nr:PEP-CTERM sorting domain-containing protein [Verrucomicrobiaceae bacterium R5-34]